MPELPDYWDVNEVADDAHAFRLATSPSRSFLNTSFSETKSSKAREGEPSVMIHPDDLATLGLEDGATVTLGNARGQVSLKARGFEGLQRGIVVAEGVWPNSAHHNGLGINNLTSADAIAPFGGAAFHDTKVWIRSSGL